MRLVKNNNVISCKSEISEISNKYFGDISKELDRANRELPDDILDIENPVGKTTEKYKSHCSIKKINRMIGELG